MVWIVLWKWHHWQKIIALMEPYFGRHSSEHVIKGKPIRWLYWMVLPLQGSTTVILKKYKHCDLNTCVVLMSTYFHNFFTSLPFLQQLRHLGGQDHSKKKTRGCMKYLTSDTNTITWCKWDDNYVDTLTSNCTKVLPIVPVKRFYQKKNKFTFQIHTS